MKKKSKYVNHSHISEKKFREFLRYFCMDLTAKQITDLSHLNIHTVNRFIHLIRVRMYELCLLQSVPLKRQIEVDESYFGAKRIKGKRGREATGKTLVFGV